MLFPFKQRYKEKDLSKVTQLLSGKTKIWIEAI